MSTGGGQGNNYSFSPALSPDGRFVAFRSIATNLVPGDTNDRGDVFVRDRRTGRTERVSLGPLGPNTAQADDDSGSPALSADGRFVAFSSDATNLVLGDTNDRGDVFVRDRRTGRTERVSGGPGGVQANHVSRGPAISADGRFVAFTSFADNLVPGDTNGMADVFVHDRLTRTNQRVSVGPGGVEGNDGFIAGVSLSPDGRFVAFTSRASNLVPGDTNGADDVFVRDRRAGRTTRVNLGPGGAQGNGDSLSSPAISTGGRFVAFESFATDLVPDDTNDALDVFLHDRRTGRTERVSVGPGGAQADNGGGFPAISPGGRFVAFLSDATNLVPGDTNFVADVFVRDRVKETTERVSLGRHGAQANGTSYEDLAIAEGGRFVAFESFADKLVPGDTNGVTDIFVRSR